MSTGIEKINRIGGGSIYCTIMVEKRLALWYNGEKGGMLRGVGNL